MGSNEKLPLVKKNRFHVFWKLFCCIPRKRCSPKISKNLVHSYSQYEDTYHGIGDTSFASSESSLSNIDIAISKGEAGLYPLAEEFKNSLEKLDHLINTLTKIQGIFTIKRTVPLECDEVLEFKIKINDTCIQCHSVNGQLSLRVLDSSSKATCATTTKTCEGASSIKLEKGLQIQRSFHTLPNNFQYLPHLLRHVKMIRSDVTSLKNIISRVECVMDKETNYFLSLSVEDFQHCFWQSGMSLIGPKPLLSSGEKKIMDAKISAANFCRFHKLNKIHRNRSKPRKKFKSRRI